MSANCNDNTSCDTASASCATRPCGSPADKCPIECATEMWQASFMQAMRETQTEIIKAKIKKAWGPMMEQAADGVIESMGACWESMIAEIKAAEAKQEFKEKLRDLWLADKK
jgi:hypothetical protein